MSAREAWLTFAAEHGLHADDRDFKRVFLAGYGACLNANWSEVEEDIEGGQPNGSGEIEPSDYREWFTEDRETHHRQRRLCWGPWIDGSVKSVQP